MLRLISVSPPVTDAETYARPRKASGKSISHSVTDAKTYISKSTSH